MLEQRAKKCIELRGECVELIPSLVAVACFLPGRTKDLSVPTRIFERKILRRIYGPMCERGQSWKRYSRELEVLYSEPNIDNVMKASRLRWVGHIVRMDEKELPKGVIWTNSGGQRGRG
jgi:hypothetical protein